MTRIQEIWLAMKATREARRSKALSQKGAQMAKASSRFSNASRRYSEAARDTEQSGNFYRWFCLRLYAKLLFICAGWLLGRSTQFFDRAQVKLERSRAILDSLGVKRDLDAVKQKRDTEAG